VTRSVGEEIAQNIYIKNLYNTFTVEKGWPKCNTNFGKSIFYNLMRKSAQVLHGNKLFLAIPIVASLESSRVARFFVEHDAKT
jgi:hypothetical protein